LTERNATAAVIGAGDFIGSAIAKKFAAEGFTIFAGRRNPDKLAPLVADIEAAGGKVIARGLDARKEDDIAAFLRAADAHAPLEVCIFNIGANGAWRRRLCGVREREIRTARRRPEHGQGARTEEYPNLLVSACSAPEHPSLIAVPRESLSFRSTLRPKPTVRHGEIDDLLQVPRAASPDHRNTQLRRTPSKSRDAGVAGGRDIFGNPPAGTITSASFATNGWTCSPARRCD